MHRAFVYFSSFDRVVLHTVVVAAAVLILTGHY